MNISWRGRVVFIPGREDEMKMTLSCLIARLEAATRGRTEVKLLWQVTVNLATLCTNSGAATSPPTLSHRKIYLPFCHTPQHHNISHYWTVLKDALLQLSLKYLYMSIQIFKTVVGRSCSYKPRWCKWR